MCILYIVTLYRKKREHGLDTTHALNFIGRIIGSVAPVHKKSNNNSEIVRNRQLGGHQMGHDYHALVTITASNNIKHQPPHQPSIKGNWFFRKAFEKNRKIPKMI